MHIFRSKQFWRIFIAIGFLCVVIVGGLVLTNIIPFHPLSSLVSENKPQTVSSTTTQSLSSQSITAAPTGDKNVKAATATPHPAKMISVTVTAYTLEGPMADGKMTHNGACAVSTAQFPLGTIIYLYNKDRSFNRKCVAEDTGGDVSYGKIDLAMPGDDVAATNWGVRTLLARVMRWGWSNNSTPPPSA